MVYGIIKKIKTKETQVYSLDTVHQFGLVAGSVSSVPALAKITYFTVLNVHALDKIVTQLCFPQVQSHILNKTG